MWKGVYFTQSEYFFTVCNSKTLCFSALEITQKLRQTHMLAKGMSESPPPSQSFFWVHCDAIKLWWKMMKPNIKVERISLLLSRIHRKMENYFCISAEILLPPDALRHLSVNSPDHHTQASNSIISMFLINCSVSMIRGLLCNLTLLKGRVFPVVFQSKCGTISKNTTEWPLKMFCTCKMGCTVVITQKTFSANFGINKWIKDFYSSCKCPISNIP